LILGPALGGLLAHLGGAPLLGGVAATASAAGALLVGVLAPGSQRGETVQTEAKKRSTFALLRSAGSLRYLFAVSAVAWFSLACLEGTFGRLIERNLGYGSREFGLIFAYESMLGVLVQGVLLEWISKRVRASRLLPLAYAGQGLGLTTMAFALNLTSLLAASTIYSLGSSLANPTINQLASRQVEPERQGELFGLLQSARSLSFIVGPMIGGALFDFHAFAPYVLAGAVCFAASLAVVRIPDPT
jgi:predicted MFS family arabinose efflux permease